MPRNPDRHNKSNRAWLARHTNDPYVRLAQQQQYRSRAAYKLIEIDDTDKLLIPGATVIDLGSAPGAWSQVLRRRLVGRGRPKPRLLALDLLPMEPVDGVEFILGDFREPAVFDRVVRALDGRAADLIVSDLAPNLSGVAAADAARMADLIELALELARGHLAPHGALLVKAFQGSGFSQSVESFKAAFTEVRVRKPKASRSESAETYLLGRRLKTPATPRPAGDER